MMKRSCKYCEATITKSLSDFWEMGWCAVSFNRRLAVCACPKHAENLQEEMQNALVRNVFKQFHEAKD